MSQTNIPDETDANGWEFPAAKRSKIAKSAKFGHAQIRELCSRLLLVAEASAKGQVTRGQWLRACEETNIANPEYNSAFFKLFAKNGVVKYQEFAAYSALLSESKNRWARLASVCDPGRLASKAVTPALFVKMFKLALRTRERLQYAPGPRGLLVDGDYKDVRAAAKGDDAVVAALVVLGDEPMKPSELRKSKPLKKVTKYFEAYFDTVPNTLEGDYDAGLTLAEDRTTLRRTATFADDSHDSTGRPKSKLMTYVERLEGRVVGLEDRVRAVRERATTVRTAGTAHRASVSQSIVSTDLEDLRGQLASIGSQLHGLAQGREPSSSVRTSTIRTSTQRSVARPALRTDARTERWRAQKRKVLNEIEDAVSAFRVELAAFVKKLRRREARRHGGAVASSSSASSSTPSASITSLSSSS